MGHTEKKHFCRTFFFYRSKQTQTTKPENTIPNNPIVINTNAKADSPHEPHNLLVVGTYQTNNITHQKTIYNNARTP